MRCGRGDLRLASRETPRLEIGANDIVPIAMGLNLSSGIRALHIQEQKLAP